MVQIDRFIADLQAIVRQPFCERDGRFAGDIEECDIGALRGDGFDDARADPGTAAGDQGTFTRKAGINGARWSYAATALRDVRAEHVMDSINEWRGAALLASNEKVAQYLHENSRACGEHPTDSSSAMGQVGVVNQPNGPV